MLGLLPLTLALAAAILQFAPAETPEEPEQEIRIVAQRFHFTPSKLKVKSGARVKFALESRDTFHGFRLEGSGIDVVIPARGRGTVEVEWTAPEPGRYEFVCSKRCGAGHAGMRGSIIVE